MVYNKEEALNLLGAICNDLSILNNNNYILTELDFDDSFHKIIFGVLNNLSLESDVKSIDGFMLNGYLIKFPIQHKMFELNNGIEFINAIKNIKSPSFEYSYRTVKKMTMLRSYKSIGMDISEIYNENTLDVKLIEEQRKRLDKMSLEDIKNFFKIKILDVETEFKTSNDCYSFEASKGIFELIDQCNKGQSWGLPFQSKYFNTIFRGIKGSKYMIRSAGTGGGKSRQSIGDCCNLSCSHLFIKGKWKENKNIIPTTFISTELKENEVQLAMLATVSGIDEERIKDGFFKPEELEILRKAGEIISKAPIYCEFDSDFTISSIETTIEKNIIRNKVNVIFFDYIQITPSLSRELGRLFNDNLREDMKLNYLSTALKNLANKYDVFILSSTQINRSYKHDNYVDVTHLRGGMATADKADFVVITLKVTESDLEKLAPILEEGFIPEPTHAHHIIKNRGGKWVGVIVWVHMDLGNMRVEDCFVTKQDFELVYDIEMTEL